VPTLLVDGESLTENPVILNWFSDAYPDAKLLPKVGTELLRAHQMLDLVFVGSTLHPAVAHYAMPSHFVTEKADPIRVVRPAAGLTLHHLLAKVEDRLEAGPWWYGQTWSVVDAYL
jgi:glutathione S-transferase